MRKRNPGILRELFGYLARTHTREPGQDGQAQPWIIEQQKFLEFDGCGLLARYEP
jgi:hypothetical protein